MNFVILHSAIFFAGIGVWSYALCQAGWSDDRPVWTGSCPCQPFSSAGKGKGFKDERHLWPEFYRLISQCRPTVCFGEQVASKDGLAWVELVQDNMEGAGYAFGAVDTCSASFGAPHIRQRLYWVAYPNLDGSQGWLHRGQDAEREAVNGQAGCNSATFGMADTDSKRCSWEHSLLWQKEGRRVKRDFSKTSGGGETVLCRGCVDKNYAHALQCPNRTKETNGFWRDADWLYCRDGKWRAVEPGTFPLAHGAPARVVRLRGYGNAINAEQAKAFIEAYLEVTGGTK